MAPRQLRITRLSLKREDYFAACYLGLETTMVQQWAECLNIDHLCSNNCKYEISVKRKYFHFCQGEKKKLFNLFKNVNENNSDYIIMWKLNELFVSAM